MSRCDVAKAMVEILKKKIEVIPVPSSYFSKQFSCPRAKNEGLGTMKKERETFSCMRDWRESLKDYLKEYYV